MNRFRGLDEAYLLDPKLVTPCHFRCAATGDLVEVGRLHGQVDGAIAYHEGVTRRRLCPELSCGLPEASGGSGVRGARVPSDLEQGGGGSGRDCSRVRVAVARRVAGCMGIAEVDGGLGELAIGEHGGVGSSP